MPKIVWLPTFQWLRDNPHSWSVVGRTQYRTARVGQHIEKVTREEGAVVEDRLTQWKDNHVVVIIQVHDKPYYVFLSDFSAIIGSEIIWENW